MLRNNTLENNHHQLSPLWALLAGLILYAGAASAAVETVQLADGETVEVLFFLPEHAGASHQAGQEAVQPEQAPRLALLMAAGSGNQYMAKAQYWVGRELVERGWAIAVPVSPDGGGYFQRKRTRLPELIAALYSRFDLRDDKPLLVGISGGGSRALQTAISLPGAFSGVVAAPGRLDGNALLPELAGLPVFLRIGENDNYRWNRLLPDMERRLLLAGARVDAALIPEGRHLFQLDWQELERWLDTLGTQPR